MSVCVYLCMCVVNWRVIRLLDGVTVASEAFALRLQNAGGKTSRDEADWGVGEVLTGWSKPYEA